MAAPDPKGTAPAAVSGFEALAGIRPPAGLGILRHQSQSDVVKHREQRLRILPPQVLPGAQIHRAGRSSRMGWSALPASVR